MLEGQEELAALLMELARDDANATALAAAVRQESAWANYYAAWQLRLEGATPDEWKPEAEEARQQFRWLAESALPGSAEREAFEKDLEATIRLEQMDLGTLMARPKPKNCPNCSGLCQRKRKKCQSQCRGKGPSRGQQQDARKEIKEQHGAGLNGLGDGGS